MYQFLGLNENLIARIYPVNPQGIRLAGSAEIQAPLTGTRHKPQTP
ncbi:MAG: hypothetical protein PHE17_09005 [Thiothrix sp.]|nr:hypothetical protein [Thiothrix sp.]MDD5393142.1 hypothetical protein [Thiothrix sp.]